MESLVIQRLGRRHRKAKVVTLDFDSTVDRTHGEQQLTLFNGFYDTWCYLPLLGGYVFLGEAFRHEVVGFEQIHEGRHHVYLGPRRLGGLDGRTNTVVPLAIDGDLGAVTDESGHEEQH